MKKIKDKFVGAVCGVKDAIKGVAKLVGYIAAASSFIYAVVFAVKNHRNGKPFYVNLLAGFIYGIGKVAGSAISVVGEQE